MLGRATEAIFERIGPPEAWKCTGWARTGVGNSVTAGLVCHTLESQESPGRMCLSPVPKWYGRRPVQAPVNTLEGRASPREEPWLANAFLRHGGSGRPGSRPNDMPGEPEPEWFYAPPEHSEGHLNPMRVTIAPDTIRQVLSSESWMGRGPH